MALTQNYDGDPQRAPRLSRDEQRIADAVVSALNPQLQNIGTRLENIDTRLENIDTRLDVVEESISRQTALIQANHEDITSVNQELSDFRTDQNEAWRVNGDVWNRLDANVQILMHDTD